MARQNPATRLSADTNKTLRSVLYDIIYQILLVLALSIVLGEAFERAGLPSVAGELLSGLVLGPTFLGYVTNSAEIQGVSTISLFFIVFLIGLEMKTETIGKYIWQGTTMAVTSFVIPFVIAIPLATLLFPFGVIPDLVVALAIVVPSKSIVSAMVLQYKLLELQTGQIILAATVISDTVAFIALAALSQSAASVVVLGGFVLIFVAIFAAVDRLLNSKTESFQRLLFASSKVLRRENVSYAVLIATGLLVSFIFQAVGLSYIIGAFFAGLILHDELIGKEAFGSLSRTFTRMNQGFFIPVFFGFAGVEANLLAAGYQVYGVLALIVVATVVPSLMLTYGGSRWLWKVDGDGAWDIAVVLGGRGAVGLIIATVALNDAIIGTAAYSMVILATMVISMVVPLLMRRQAKPAQT